MKIKNMVIILLISFIVALSFQYKEVIKLYKNYRDYLEEQNLNSKLKEKEKELETAQEKLEKAMVNSLSAEEWQNEINNLEATIKDYEESINKYKQEIDEEQKLYEEIIAATNKQ